MGSYPATANVAGWLTIQRGGDQKIPRWRADIKDGTHKLHQFLIWNTNSNLITHWRGMIIHRQPSAQTMGADQSFGDREMFKSWAKRKINDVGSKSSAKDLQRVVVMLKGMSDDSLAVLVIGTQVLREDTRETSGIDIAYHLSNFDNPECGEAWGHVRKMVRNCQAKEMFEVSAALMIWLHSFRAMHYLECRYYGQQMWAELFRGVRTLQAAGEPIDDYFFPADLIDFDATATMGGQVAPL